MLDDLYQSDTDAAIGDLIARPPAPRPQASKFSAWETVTAAGRGLAAGGLEAGAAVPDIAANIGTRFTRAATSMLPEPRAAGGAEFFAREASREAGAVSVEGDALRAGARSMMPDAASAHVAESLTFDLFRFGGKAVGYTVAAGPLGGALLTGVDEGLTASDQLRLQGVDLETRTQAGAVIGAVSGASVLLPVAGKTAAQTAGLIALGGPAAFMGQQAAVREILQSADYSKLADQYDPFDPVGLAVSTLVPAGFGAFAMRGARTRATAGDNAPEVRPDVETVQDAVQTEPAIPRPTPEQVDAARVEMLTQHMEQSGLYRPEDARAAAMHVDAFARAMDDLGAGRRVDVTDLIPFDRIETVRVLDTFAQRFDEARADLIAQAALRAEPGAVRQMQGEQVEAQARLAELEDPAAIKARAGELQQAQRLSYKQALSAARKEFGAQADDVRSRIERIEGMLEDNARGQQAGDALTMLDREAQAVARQRAQIDAPVIRQTPTAAAARQAIEATTTEAPANVQDAPQARPGDAAQPTQAAQPQAADAAGAGAARAGEPGRAGVSAAGGDAAEARLVEQRLTGIAEQFPDLTVQMDGMDAPMRLADFLEQVKREAAEGTDADLGGNDAPLMQVAASCFLING